MMQTASPHRHVALIKEEEEEEEEGNLTKIINIKKTKNKQITRRPNKK